MFMEMHAECKCFTSRRAEMRYIPKYLAKGSHSARLLLKLTFSFRQIIVTTRLTSPTDVIGVKVGLACIFVCEACSALTILHVTLAMIRNRRHSSTRKNFSIFIIATSKRFQVFIGGNLTQTCCVDCAFEQLELELARTAKFSQLQELAKTQHSLCLYTVSVY